MLGLGWDQEQSYSRARYFSVLAMDILGLFVLSISGYLGYPGIGCDLLDTLLTIAV